MLEAILADIQNIVYNSKDSSIWIYIFELFYKQNRKIEIRNKIQIIIFIVPLDESLFL
jgi:hypothetical protein